MADAHVMYMCDTLIGQMAGPGTQDIAAGQHVSRFCSDTECAPVQLTQRSINERHSTIPVFIADIADYFT